MQEGLALDATTAAQIQADLVADRRRELSRWLRAKISSAEAEATASSGFRSMTCGGCGRLTCRACNTDPAETVRSSGRRAAADPRHVRAVVHRLSQFSGPVLLNADAAFKRLPARERLVLALTGSGVNDDQIARSLRISVHSVRKWRADGLTGWVALVWPFTSATP